MDTLESRFEKLYLLFRANYYRRMVEVIGVREGSLTATEAYCVEIIYLMDRPTASRFAAFLDISLPNAHYKIDSLIKKGYVVKNPSSEDKREIHLAVTDKFLSYYGLNNEDNARLMQAIRASFSGEELQNLENVIDRVVTLMQEEAVS